MKNFENDSFTAKIIGATIEVHKALGPGLLESTYEKSLLHELNLRGLSVKSQVILPIHYKDIQINHGYKIDLIIEEKVVVEIKCVEKISNVHEAQILTYMRHAKIRR
ncbi:MAG: GxxExxY protein [Cryomorphaceae bacterium]